MNNTELEAVYQNYLANVQQALHAGRTYNEYSRLMLEIEDLIQHRIELARLAR